MSKTEFGIIGALLASAAVTYALWPTAEDRARERLATILLDVESARFRNLDDNGVAICGEVNARNSFGAFTGYKMFYASEGLTAFEDDEISAAFVRETCVPRIAAAQE